MFPLYPKTGRDNWDMKSLIFMFGCTCILQSNGISVCLYNQAMRSLIFMFRDVCMLVFPEVIEYLYMRMIEYYVKVW